MESEVLKLAAGQGFFAVLFVVLLFYVLRENSKREQKYQDIIEQLSELINDKIKNIESKIDNWFDRR